MSIGPDEYPLTPDRWHVPVGHSLADVQQAMRAAWGRLEREPDLVLESLVIENLRTLSRAREAADRGDNER
jgi:hypothetical protein